MKRLLVADDHPLVRRAVVGLLENDTVTEVVGQVGTFTELWDALERDAPDVVLLDARMPGGDVFDAVRRITREHANVSVLVLSGVPEEELVVRLIQAGAVGYVQKDASPEVLREAIHRVAEGGVYVGPVGTAALARAAGPTGVSRDHEKLSDREIQVLRLLGRGLRVVDIAETLHLSPKTVSTYRGRIMEKMGLSSTAQLIRYAVEHGLS